MIEEADWVIENLVHDIDLAARVENLKSRLPSIQVMLTNLKDPRFPAQEAIKIRGALVTLMNADAQAFQTGLSILLADLTTTPKKQLPLLYSTLAGLNAAEVQSFFAQEITAAAEAKK